MAKGKTIAVLLGLAALGGIAAVAAGAGEGAPRDELYAAGLSLKDDCLTLAVDNPDELIREWTDYVLETDPETWLDPEERADIEQLWLDFLNIHFPGCFPPVPGPDFRWVTNVPTVQARTWDQLIDDQMDFLDQLYEMEQEGLAVPGEPLTELAAVVATSVGPVEPFPGGLIPPEEDPDPGPPDVPIPPIPPIEPEGLGGGVWDAMPENVVEATTIQHMQGAGVERAMEPQGALSPSPSTIVLIYDPAYPELESLLDAAHDYAGQHPEVLFVLASTEDTQANLGKPAELGQVGYAVNVASKVGKYRYPDGWSAPMDKGPLNQSLWDEMVSWALGPYQAQATWVGG